MLAATNRSPMRPAHVHFRVTAPGYQTLTTHVFDESDQYLDTDAVFGVRSSLLATFDHHEPGAAPDGREMTEPWRSAQFDLILAPEDQAPDLAALRRLVRPRSRRCAAPTASPREGGPGASPLSATARVGFVNVWVTKPTRVGFGVHATPNPTRGRRRPPTEPPAPRPPLTPFPR